LQNEKGETRRERNKRFGVEDTPFVDLNETESGWQFWEWYWSVSRRIRRVRDNACEPIPPSEFEAWCRLTNTIILPLEYEILCAMDDAFCAEMNSELSDYNERQTEAQKANANKPVRRK